jgi:hypothetical protein
MTLVENCVAFANSAAILLGASACILRAHDSWAQDDRYHVHSRLMLQAMWIIALCVFVYFHVTFERTDAVINTPQFLFLIMAMLFLAGPFAYCPIFTFLHWAFTD